MGLGYSLSEWKEGPMVEQTQPGSGEKCPQMALGRGQGIHPHHDILPSHPCLDPSQTPGASLLVPGEQLQPQLLPGANRFCRGLGGWELDTRAQGLWWVRAAFCLQGVMQGIPWSITPTCWMTRSGPVASTSESSSLHLTWYGEHQAALPLRRGGVGCEQAAPALESPVPPGQG